MSTQNQNGYMLLYRSHEWYKALSHEELQKVISQNNAWIERLTAQGKAKPGRALERKGATVSGKKGSSFPMVRSLNPRKPLADTWC